jgi:putative hydrolase of the HAD superfamily
VSPALVATPKIVFFDVGDTLVRIDPSWSAIYLRCSREFGVDVDEAALKKAVDDASAAGFWDSSVPFEATEEASYQRIKAFDQKVMASLGHGDLPDRFYRRLGELFLASEAWHVFPEVRGVLDRLGKAGLRTAVISNWVWGLPELLHDLDLAHHFEYVVVSSRVGYDKPHTGIFEHALERAGVSGSEAVHVGDNPATDVAGARAAGIRPILIRRRPPTHTHGPDGVSLEGVAIIADLRELPALLGLETPTLQEGVAEPDGLAESATRSASTGTG